VLVAGAREELPVASMRVEPAMSLTQSLTEAVWVAVRNSPASDSLMLRGGRLTPWSVLRRSVVAEDADGDLAVDVDVLHELHEVEVRVEVLQPDSFGFQGKFTFPFSSGRSRGFKRAVVSLAMSRSVFPARSCSTGWCGADRRTRTGLWGGALLACASGSNISSLLTLKNSARGASFMAMKDAAIPPELSEELPPADAQLLRDALGELLDAELDLLLLLRLADSAGTRRWTPSGWGSAHADRRHRRRATSPSS